jgi:hypothetical protein
VTLRTEQVDLFAWDWRGRSFDIIAAIFIQFATPEQRTTLFTNIKQSLAPGGYLILQGYRPKQLDYGTGGPPNAENMYTEDLLRRSFGDLTIIHLSEHDDVIVEGAGHAGMSALIDLVARK